MESKDYSTTLETTRTTNEVFTAINNVHLWWTENFEGKSKRVNDEFTVTFGETYITLKVIEILTNYKIVWHVTDAHKHFLKDKKEWTGTKIVFDIANLENRKTKVTFTHIGLAPALECFSICTDAWNGYVHGSLKKLIDTGTGTPDKKDVATITGA